MHLPARLIALIATVALVPVVAAGPAHAVNGGEPGRILFVGEGNDWYSVEPDGTDLRLVAPKYRTLHWSPDGAEIMSVTGGLITVMEADGSQERTVYNPPKTVFVQDAAWSPDSKRIAFIDGSGRPTDIWIVTIATGAIQQVTDDESIEESVTWSPDGDRLAYVEDRGVRILDLTTGEDEALPTIATWRDVSWSPDGATLAGSDSNILLFDLASHVESYGIQVSYSAVNWTPDNALTYSDGGTMYRVEPDGAVATELLPGIEGGGPRQQARFVTISASARKVRYGATITFQGELLPDTAKRTLELWRRPGNRTTYRLVGQVTADAGGNATIAVEAEVTSTYMLRWAGDGTSGPGRSPGIEVSVQSILRAKVFGQSGRSGKWFIFREGKTIVYATVLLPVDAGKRKPVYIEVQYQRGRQWRTGFYDRWATDREGRIAIAFRAPPGRYRAYAIFEGSKTALPSQVPASYIKVIA